MALLLQQLRERRARRQAEVLNRQLYREQRRVERRQRLRWELERRWSGRPRPDLREWDMRRRWVERPRLVQQQPVAPARPPRDLRYGVAVGRVVAAVVVLLVGGTLAGYAVFLAVNDPEEGTASVDGAVRPAAGGPDGAAPRSMPGITDPGVFLSVTRDATGELVATERVRATESLEELSIAPPPPPPGSRWLPRLEDVELTVDGDAVALPDGIDAIEVATVVPLSDPGTLVELHYRVVGVITTTEPAAAKPARKRSPKTTPVRDRSAPQLSVISLRPALGPMLEDANAVVEVYGARVHDLTCVDRPKRLRECGVDLGDGWRTQPMPAAKSSVLVVVDRPDPAA
jgi:hypothetical protein